MQRVKWAKKGLKRGIFQEKLALRQRREEIAREVEARHHFSDRIAALEDELRACLPRERWSTLAMLLDLTTKEQIAAIELALSERLDR